MDIDYDDICFINGSINFTFLSKTYILEIKDQKETWKN